MKIAIVGQGYVGLPLAMAAARVGHKVIGLELNLEKVALLNSATSYVSDVPNVELKKYLYEGTYIPQSNFEELRNCDIVIICVPTPLDDKGEPDLSALRAASRNIANNVSDKTLIINTPGQSGDSNSPFYQNLFTTWANDSYFPSYYSKQLIEQNLAEKWILKP